MKVRLDKDALIDIINEITCYQDRQFAFDVAIWQDGSVERGDLNINCNSWTEWRKQPLLAFRVHPWYTLQDIDDDGGDSRDVADCEAYSQLATYMVGRYVDELADLVEKYANDHDALVDAVSSMDCMYGEMRW